MNSLVGDAELESLERLVGAALAGRDASGLNVVGFGEVSVALGWPVDDPAVVCKRMPPMTVDEYSAYVALVTEYTTALGSAGLSVVDTSVASVRRASDRRVAYVIQPLLDGGSLGHNVLAAADPDPSHPFLAALAQSLQLVTDRLSFDAQVTNFAWDGVELTLVDVGTPFCWSADGALRLDMGPFTPMISAPLRGVIKRDLLKVIDRWKDPRNVGVDVVANLYREGLADWMAPAATALSAELGGRPITMTEAMAVYEEDRATFPRLTRLQRLERWWRTSVRRGQYDFFINDTYGDDRSG